MWITIVFLIVQQKNDFPQMQSQLLLVRMWPTQNQRYLLKRLRQSRLLQKHHWKVSYKIYTNKRAIFMKEYKFELFVHRTRVEWTYRNVVSRYLLYHVCGWITLKLCGSVFADAILDTLFGWIFGWPFVRKVDRFSPKRFAIFEYSKSKLNVLQRFLF